MVSSSSHLLHSLSHDHDHDQILSYPSCHRLRSITYHSSEDVHDRDDTDDVVMLLLSSWTGLTCSHPLLPVGGGGETKRNRRRLTIDERKSYIGAVKCMMKKPGIAPMEAVTNRFEDFLATHIVQALDSHFVVCSPPALLLWTEPGLHD